MRLARNSRTAALLFVASLLAQPASAQWQQTLGRVESPVTTASEQARAHFLRGVLALHSFWYEEAREEFRAATAAEPSRASPTAPARS